MGSVKTRQHPSAVCLLSQLTILCFSLRILELSNLFKKTRRAWGVEGDLYSRNLSFLLI